jgi:predicted nucleotide-binding protein
MKPEKPMLFIGSSQEAREAQIVKDFIDVLGDYAHCIPWWLDPQFREEGSTTTFQALCAAANNYDFAAFILTHDDKLEHRKASYQCPRDNVVFEVGLFIGAIGPERVMAYVQMGTSGAMPLKILQNLLLQCRRLVQASVP